MPADCSTDNISIHRSLTTNSVNMNKSPIKKILAAKLRRNANRLKMKLMSQIETFWSDLDEIIFPTEDNDESPVDEEAQNKFNEELELAMSTS